MGKIKKYQLLEKAMRDYPKGTMFKSASTGEVFESSGIFEFLFFAGISIISKPTGCVYDMEYDKWAEIIPSEPEEKSILDGKVAIQVNNEREFKLLMEHYDKKGWSSLPGKGPLEVIFSLAFKYEEYLVSYHNEFCCPSYRVCKEYDYDKSSIFNPENYKIIPFADFAAEVGIEVPKFILTSEDGVDLYEGDLFYSAELTNKGWVLDCWVNGRPYELSVDSLSVTNPDKYKAFSTKESAEAWIKENNKPKEILLNFNGGWSVITKDKIRVHLDAENGKCYFMKASEIVPIYEAYKSLQGKEDTNER